MIRAERLAAAVRERELDALIVSAPANVRWASAFSGTSGLILIGPAVRRFLTDFRYREQVAVELEGDWEVEIVTGTLLAALAVSLPAGRIGFDDAHLSVRAHAGLAEHAAAHAELIAAGGLVEDLRAIKDDDELARIAAAARLVDEVYGALCADGLVGRNERDVAAWLEHEMRRRGAEAASFPSIVASGAHAALPHAAARDAPIESGTLVVVDIGAVLDGYCSDCTRTFAAGAPSGAAQEIYDLVLEAQRTGLQSLRAGPTGREVDAAAREVIAQAGHAEHFGHGLGHGVGIEVHEAPRLSREAPDEPLRAGSVVTVEPGIYIPGELGVRIEDLAVVTDGPPRVLSGFGKELLTLS